MSTAILDAPASESTTNPRPQENLATATERLAALRFFILLTARREAYERAEPQEGEQMESDLGWLRAQYFDMIDEIAMTYGVQQAMNAKRDVELEVTVPREWPKMETQGTEQQWF